MDSISSLAFDQIHLKGYLSVFLHETREGCAESLSEIAERGNMPLSVLQQLEENAFEPNLDMDLLIQVAKCYRIQPEQMVDLVRTACVSKLVHVIEKLEEIPDV